MHKQLVQFVDFVVGAKSNRLLDNMTQSEVRRNTVLFLGILSVIGVFVIVLQLLGQNTSGLNNVILNFAWGGFYLAAFTLVTSLI